MQRRVASSGCSCRPREYAAVAPRYSFLPMSAFPAAFHCEGPRGETILCRAKSASSSASDTLMREIICSSTELDSRFTVLSSDRRQSRTVYSCKEGEKDNHENGNGTGGVTRAAIEGAALHDGFDPVDDVGHVSVHAKFSLPGAKWRRSGRARSHDADQLKPGIRLRSAIDDQAPATVSETGVCARGASQWPSTD